MVFCLRMPMLKINVGHSFPCPCRSLVGVLYITTSFLIKDKQIHVLFFPSRLLIRKRDERPEDWVPEKTPRCRRGDEEPHMYSGIHEGDEVRNKNIAGIYSVHSGNEGNPC